MDDYGRMKEAEEAVESLEDEDVFQGDRNYQDALERRDRARDRYSKD